MIAEYVETEAQRDQLAAPGCTIYQGYLYCKDMPADALPHLLNSQQEGNPSDIRDAFSVRPGSF